MRRRGAAILLLLCVAARGGTIRLERVASRSTGTEPIRGAVISANTLLTWGEALRSWSLPQLSGGRPITTGAPFGEGGCLMDVDGDGLADLIAQQGAGLGRLVWLAAPRWTPHTIDTGVTLHDCVAATLFGRRGVLIIHRDSQVRFYEPLADPARPWSYREIYSIYTPSRQGGLLLADIDGNGRTDILCGNYWIRSPESWEQSWRLFAINTFTETADSALARVALAPGPGRRALVWAESHRAPGRLAWFSQPDDPTELWPEVRLATTPPLAFPHALLVEDFDGDGKPDVLVGENNGVESRLLLFRQERAGHFTVDELFRGASTLTAFKYAGRLVTVGPNAVTVWRILAGSDLRRGSNPRAAARTGR